MKQVLALLLAVGVFASGNGGMARLGPKLPPPDSLPDPPGPVVVGKMGLVAAGDTLPYTISWGPGARASSYDVTLAVTNSNGIWAVAADSNTSGKWLVGNGVGPLPSTASVTFPVLKTWLTAVPWDSATFIVTVFSRNALGPSLTGSVRTWRVSRRPGPPGPIVVDSSLIVIGLQTLPKTANLLLGASRTFCAFQTFGNGAVTEWTASRPNCDSIYTAYVPAAARALVTAAQQAHTDSLTKTCVAWSTDAPLALGLAPTGTCSSAVVVTGLQLSRARADQLQFRYARWPDPSGPVLSVTRTGLARCLRPGIGYVTGTREDGSTVLAKLKCVANPLPTFLALAQP